MTRARLATLALTAGALAACGKSSTPAQGLLLNEPSAVVAFRGVTIASPDLRHPYLAIANAGSSDVTFVDAIDDSAVLAPVPLRPLVYSIPGRPTMLASADLQDAKPDLLVAVSAGDSNLQVIRTWSPDGGIQGTVDMGGDIIALIAVPSPAGQARLAAALAGQRVAVVTFPRSTAGDGTAIDVANATVVTSDALGFQPLALAVLPLEQTTLWAATRDDLGGGAGVFGVARIDISGGAPAPAGVLNALAPTRLVVAARLAGERPSDDADPVAASTLTVAAFATQPTVNRVYAVLDESGCGLNAKIACGVVALDPTALDTTGNALLLDPSPTGTMNAGFRAPIAIPGAVRSLAAAQPPAVSPPDLDPTFAGTYMPMVTAAFSRITTAVAAVSSTDGFVYFIDLGRWEIPGNQTVTPTATPVAAMNPEATAADFVVTPGYTPTVRWTATWEGQLPGLASRQAESGVLSGGAPWLALQAEGGALGGFVSVYDPALGIHDSDLVVDPEKPDLAVISGFPAEDPDAVGSCASTFEARIAHLLAPSSLPSANYPGGALQLEKIPDEPGWGPCVDALAKRKAGLIVTIRGGGWVLVRGSGTDAVLAGRPATGTQMAVQWEDETPLSLSCPTPPVTSCDPISCRLVCERLMRARIARRIGYVPAQGDPQGPALAFTLSLRAGLTKPTRDFAVAIDTADGRSPLRTVPQNVTAVGPGQISLFDRSRDYAPAGVRFLVPYESNVVLDAAPTSVGAPATLH